MWLAILILAVLPMVRSGPAIQRETINHHRTLDRFHNSRHSREKVVNYRSGCVFKHASDAVAASFLNLPIFSPASASLGNLPPVFDK